MDTRKVARWGPLIAVVVFAIIGGAALEQVADNNAQKLRNAVVESCERVNDLRREVNTQTTVMQDLVTFAADVAAAEGDLETAQLYRDYVDQMHIVDLTQCEEEFPRFSLAHQ